MWCVPCLVLPVSSRAVRTVSVPGIIATLGVAVRAVLDPSRTLVFGPGLDECYADPDGRDLGRKTYLVVEARDARDRTLTTLDGHFEAVFTDVRVWMAHACMHVYIGCVGHATGVHRMHGLLFITQVDHTNGAPFAVTRSVYVGEGRYAFLYSVTRPGDYDVTINYVPAGACPVVGVGPGGCITTGPAGTVEPTPGEGRVRLPKEYRVHVLGEMPVISPLPHAERTWYRGTFSRMGRDKCCICD